MGNFKTTGEDKDRSQAEINAIEQMQEVAQALVDGLREQGSFPQTTIVNKDASGLENKSVVDCTVKIDVSENTETGKIYSGIVFQGGKDMLRVNYDLENMEATSFQYKKNAFDKGSKWEWANKVENAKLELVALTKIIPAKAQERTGNGSVGFNVFLQMAKSFRARTDVPTMTNKDGKTVQAYGISNFESSDFTSKKGNEIKQNSFELYQKQKPDSNVKESVRFTMTPEGRLKNVQLRQLDYNTPANGKNYTFTTESVRDGNFTKFNKLTEDKNITAYVQDLMNVYQEAVKGMDFSDKTESEEDFVDIDSINIDEDEMPFN